MPAAIPDLTTPDDIEGTTTATWRDAPMIWWWQVRGWTYGASKAQEHHQLLPLALNLMFALVGCAIFWLLIPVAAVRLASDRSRFYLDAERTAVLAITPSHGRWLLEDHSSAHPGTGEGSRLRGRLLPTLLATADHREIPIELETSVPQLVKTYSKELGPLEFIGRSRIGRLRYRRDPVSAPNVP